MAVSVHRVCGLPPCASGPASRHADGGIVGPATVARSGLCALPFTDMYGGGRARSRPEDVLAYLHWCKRGQARREVGQKSELAAVPEVAAHGSYVWFSTHLRADLRGACPRALVLVISEKAETIASRDEMTGPSAWRSRSLRWCALRGSCVFRINGDAHSTVAQYSYATVTNANTAAGRPRASIT